MEIHHEINSAQMVMRLVCWNKAPHRFHWHENIEILRAINKPFGVLIDGIYYWTEPGDILIIDKQSIHKFDILENDTRVLLGQFSYSILLGYGELPVSIKPLIRRCEIENDEKLSNYINLLFDVLEHERRTSTDEKNIFMRCMYSGLYYLLMDKFPDTDEASTKSKEKQDFYKIVEYTNTHFDQIITVQSIAKELYMDRGRVSGLFAKFAGTTLTGYINSMRITKAQRLIEGGASKTSAAMESGFQSLRTFNNVYKRIILNQKDGKM